MSVLINFRIDNDLKNKMDKVCKDIGITMSAAFNMFAKNLVSSESIEFSLNKKVKSGIDYKNLFKGSNDESESVKIEGEQETIDSVIKHSDKYYINKIGNIIMLVPKDDIWSGIRDSSGKISDDFMNSRVQIRDREREEI